MTQKCIKCKKKTAIYNKSGKNPLYCSDCKGINMVNVISKMCIKCKKTRPSFNKIGATPLYCSKCKEKDMVDVINKKCIKCKKKHPNFNKLDNPPLYCADCKLDGMIDVINPKCIKCKKKQPHFNRVGEKALYCADCKENDMINVISKMCIKCKKKQPHFNIVGEIPLYCADCKEKDMVNVLSKMCIKCKKKYPTFNKSGEVALYCAVCREKDMVNVKDKKCQTPMCDTLVSNPKYKGYCLRCFMYTFPNEKVSKNYKTKEKYIADWIKETFSNVKWIFDKKIEGGCSKRRPDIILDLKTHVIIIEIDENQHTDYNSSCENKRLMEISQDLGHPNIVFIRFNPDNYIDRFNKRHKSCWMTNKKGICIVDKDEEKALKWRLNTLKAYVFYWLNHIPQKNITIESLYFDEPSIKIYNLSDFEYI